jgi:hypothetical protein
MNGEESKMKILFRVSSNLTGTNVLSAEGRSIEDIVAVVKDKLSNNYGKNPYVLTIITEDDELSRSFLETLVLDLSNQWDAHRAYQVVNGLAQIVRVQQAIDKAISN